MKNLRIYASQVSQVKKEASKPVQFNNVTESTSANSMYKLNEKTLE